MTNKYTGDNTLRQNPLLLLLLLAITIFLGYLVGTLFVDFSLRILFHSTITEIVNTKDSISLLLVQGITSFFSFLLAPGIFAKVWMKMDVQELFQGRVNHHLTLMTLVLLVVIVPFNSFLVEYNADLQMPSFLAEFEQYAQDMEKKLEELVLSMLSFDSIPQLILAIFVIGFIPAVGEELLFRGLIQKTFVSSIKNPYLAIILVATLFSAFHLQFYGFIPRLMLGMVLGLIYYWSNNLIYPITFHFLNNSLTVFFFYLYNIGIIDTNIMDNRSLPYLTVIFSLVVTLMSLAYFRKLSLKGSRTNG